VEETSGVFGVGMRTLFRWKKQKKETRSLDRKPLNRKPKKPDMEGLRRYAEDHPEPICGRWQRSLVGEKQHRQGTEKIADQKRKIWFTWIKVT
jgi:transposase